MSQLSFADLLQRRLVFTVGKGGVGRTTVTLGIALEAARRGQRVLVVELEGARGLEMALAAQREQVHPPAWLDRIEYMMIDGRRALEEYLGLIIPVRRLLKTVFSSNVYQYFVAAAPGLKELMAIGKLWYEAEQRNPEDAAGASGAHQLVLVDGPATGHSLQYLRMPQAALEAFPTGLVHREAERVVGLLRDPEATGVVVTTLAEEMPANETFEMVRGLDALGMHTAMLVVNQVHHAPCTRAELDGLPVAAPRPLAVVPATRARSARTPANPEVLLSEIVARAHEEIGWAEINASHVQRLAAQINAPLVELPYLFNEEFGPDEVCRLGRTLAEQLDAVPPTAPRPRGGRK
ncbi:ArsA family ATPase [Candidatus Binatia bacterium]|nr:ArsA family ATPase [Candidatus Binatia bacterium]